VQQKLRLNRGQGQIWTWFKLDRRWWNAPLVYSQRVLLLYLYGLSMKSFCYTIRYDTIAEFNVDSKAEYTA